MFLCFGPAFAVAACCVAVNLCMGYFVARDHLEGRVSTQAERDLYYEASVRMGGFAAVGFFVVGMLVAAVIEHFIKEFYDAGRRERERERDPGRRAS